MALETPLDGRLQAALEPSLRPVAYMSRFTVPGCSMRLCRMPGLGEQMGRGTTPAKAW